MKTIFTLIAISFASLLSAQCQSGTCCDQGVCPVPPPKREPFYYQDLEREDRAMDYYDQPDVDQEPQINNDATTRIRKQP